MGQSWEAWKEEHGSTPDQVPQFMDSFFAPFSKKRSHHASTSALATQAQIPTCLGTPSSPPRFEVSSLAPLFVEDDGKQILVAQGVVESSRLLHGAELSDDLVKVQIKNVVVPGCSLPYAPDNEVTRMQDVLGTFVAWPKMLVGVRHRVPNTDRRDDGFANPIDSLLSKNYFIDENTITIAIPRSVVALDETFNVGVAEVTEIASHGCSWPLRLSTTSAWLQIGVT